MSPKQTYIIDRVLHWLSSIAIIFLLLDMGTRVHNIDYRIKGAIQHKQDAIELHTTIAFILLLILLMRLLWTRFFLHPDHQTKHHSNRHKWLVNIVHSSMYLTLLLMMLTGVFMLVNYEHSLTMWGIFNFSEHNVSRALFASANSWHLWFKDLIYFLIFLHVAGAMYSRR